MYIFCSNPNLYPLKLVLIDISIYLGLISGVVSGVNFLLPKKAKEVVQNSFEDLWVWLEYKKLINFYRVKQGSEYLIPISIIVTLFLGQLINFAFIADLDEPFHEVFFEEYFIMLLVLVILLTITNTASYWLFPFIRRFYSKNKAYILDTNELSQIIHRSIAFNFKPIFIPLYVSGCVPDARDFVLLPYAFILYPILALNGIWLTISIWMLIIPVIRFLFKFLSFIVYRIASYPAGPMIFISTLFTTIASIVKIFTT